MLNLTAAKYQKDYRAARYPDGSALMYRPALQADARGDIDDAIVMEFSPNEDERQALLTGGFVRVVMRGVQTPPQMEVQAVQNTKLHEKLTSLDVLERIAKVWWENQQPPPGTDWEDAPPATRAVFLTRVEVVGKMLLSAIQSADDER